MLDCFQISDLSDRNVRTKVSKIYLTCLTCLFNVKREPTLFNESNLLF